MIEPVYSLRVAAELIPMVSAPALRMFLRTRRDIFPPRYKRVGIREVRILYENEILRIREMTFLSAGESRYGRRIVQSRSRCDDTLPLSVLFGAGTSV